MFDGTKKALLNMRLARPELFGFELRLGLSDDWPLRSLPH
jgi:hypothetical protein